MNDSSRLSRKASVIVILLIAAFVNFGIVEFHTTINRAILIRISAIDQTSSQKIFQKFGEKVLVCGSIAAFWRLSTTSDIVDIFTEHFELLQRFVQGLE